MCLPRGQETAPIPVHTVSVTIGTCMVVKMCQSSMNRAQEDGEGNGNQQEDGQMDT